VGATIVLYKSKQEITMTEDVKDQQPSELELLKKRADQLGIKYHWNIGLEKLKAQVNAAITGKTEEAAESKEEAKSEEPKLSGPNIAPNGDIIAPSGKRYHAETQQEKMNRIRKEASRLVRVRVNCMNPNKAEWEGEIFTVSNRVIGTHKKYVPFNSDEGWHVPHCIYEMMRDRECQIFVNKKNDRGQRTRESRIIKEFAIEVLPPLTVDELRKLATQQAMEKGQAATR
jgi:hypothetical protein